jgi:hypothetical protein
VRASKWSLRLSSLGRPAFRLRFWIFQTELRAVCKSVAERSCESISLNNLVSQLVPGLDGIVIEF